MLVQQYKLAWCIKCRRVRQLDIKLRLQALHQVKLLERRSEIGLPSFAVWTVGMICDLCAACDCLYQSFAT